MSPTRIATLTLLAALVALPACSRLPSVPGLPGNKNRVTAEFDDQRFRANAVATTDDRRGFAATVRGAARSVPGALEAGRLAAVTYCLNTFGGSDIDWTVGPDQPADAAALSSDGSLVLAGTCTTR